MAQTTDMTNAAATVAPFCIHKGKPPNKIIRAAPKAAALERPVVKGLAIGFPVIACIPEPAIPNPAPAITAAAILGSLNIRSTFCSFASKDATPLNIPLKEGSHVTIIRSGVSWATPRQAAHIAATSNTNRRTARRMFFLLALRR